MFYQATLLIPKLFKVGGSHIFLISLIWVCMFYCFTMLHRWCPTCALKWSSRTFHRKLPRSWSVCRPTSLPAILRSGWTWRPKRPSCGRPKWTWESSWDDLTKIYSIRYPLLSDCQTIPFKSERQINRQKWKTQTSAQNKISNFKWFKLSWKKILVSSTVTKLHKNFVKLLLR